MACHDGLACGERYNGMLRRAHRESWSIAWLRLRLANRASDARQAEARVRRLNPEAYPHAALLAEVHARVAQIYEEAMYSHE
jgi:hypothetical protein